MPKLQLAILLDAIHLMASPASIQIQNGQTSADEVALDWENGWSVAEGLFEDQLISAEVYQAVAHINQELEAIVPSDSFWSNEALYHDTRWEAFRFRAQALLVQLGQ